MCDQFENEFEKIYKYSNLKIPEKCKTHECCDNPSIFINADTDYNICENCGTCVKAYIQYHGYIKNFKMNVYTSDKHKHHLKRLKINLKRMKITNKELIDEILQRFKFIEVYYNTVDTSNSNIIRYKYIIIKLLQIMGKKEIYERFELPKKKTLIKYNKIWRDICQLNEWTYIE